MWKLTYSKGVSFNYQYIEIYSVHYDSISLSKYSLLGNEEESRNNNLKKNKQKFLKIIFLQFLFHHIFQLLIVWSEETFKKVWSSSSIEFDELPSRKLNHELDSNVWKKCQILEYLGIEQSAAY